MGYPAIRYSPSRLTQMVRHGLLPLGVQATGTYSLISLDEIFHIEEKSVRSTSRRKSYDCGEMSLRPLSYRLLRKHSSLRWRLMPRPLKSTLNHRRSDSH